MELVKDCQYGMTCRNTLCIFNHPGRHDCRYNNCSRPQCWYNHKIRMMRADSRECKFLDSCHSGSCIFNHPGRPLCSTEADCSEPTCPNNHNILLCKYGLFGGECNNEFCEFRHPGTYRDLGTHPGECALQSRGRFGREEVQEDDMITSLDFEDQLMFENEIGQFMYTEDRKPWLSSSQREVFCSNGKSLRVKISGDSDETSPTLFPHREGNLVILKDSEEGDLDNSDLRHTLTSKAPGEKKGKVTAEWRTATEARETNAYCNSDSEHGQGLSGEEDIDQYSQIQPFQTLQQPQSNTLPLPTNSARMDLRAYSQLLPQVEKKELKRRRSPQPSPTRVHLRIKQKLSPRVQGRIEGTNRRAPVRLSTVEVKSADIKTNAAVAAVLKKSTLDSQESSSNNSIEMNLSQVSQDSLIEIDPLSPSPHRQLSTRSDNKVTRSLKRKYATALKPKVKASSGLKSKGKSSSAVSASKQRKMDKDSVWSTSSYEDLKILTDKKTSQINLEGLTKGVSSTSGSNFNMTSMSSS